LTAGKDAHDPKRTKVIQIGDEPPQTKVTKGALEAAGLSEQR
jgi:hypothetical protein